MKVASPLKRNDKAIEPQLLTILGLVALFVVAFVLVSHDAATQNSHSLLDDKRLISDDTNLILEKKNRGLRSDSGKTARQVKYQTTCHYSPPGHDFSEPAPECGNCPEFESFFALDRSSRSRYDEDKIIYHLLFKGKMSGRSGTYVELGAFDGKTASNSRFFDLCLGWKGLLIEGNPGNFKKTLTNRPRAHRMSFAPSCSAEYEAVNKTVTIYRAPQANSGLEEHALAYKDKGRPTVEVPCGPLGPVLEDVFEGETINFFSLDVEGSEPLVLSTIDFRKVKLEVLMIEVSNAHCQKHCKTRDEVRNIMEKKWGYQRFSGHVDASDIFVHPDLKFVPFDLATKA